MLEGLSDMGKGKGRQLPRPAAEPAPVHKGSAGGASCA